MKSIIIPIMVIWAAPLVGCARGGPSDTFSVHDSAGVEVVESQRPSWRAGEAWSVTPEPAVRVGLPQGNPAFEFAGVVGASRLPSGGVAVADMGSQEVRFFSPQGECIGSIGRRGAGPGEFTGLSALGRGSNGSIWAYDFSLRRVTWMDSEANLLHQVSLGSEPQFITPVGWLPDGSMIFRQLWGVRQVRSATHPGLRRDEIAFIRVDSRGALVDTVGLFPGREIYLCDEEGSPTICSLPFGRTAVGVVREDRLLVGFQNSYELDEYTSSGEHIRRIRVTGRDLTLRAEEVERQIEEQVEAAPPSRQMGLRRSLEAAPVPSTRPAFGQVLPDESGNTWISSWAPFPEIPRVWDVLDSEGIWLGEVKVPEKFAPLEIGDSWLLGVELDEMGVEYVVLYALNKPAAAG